MKCLLNFSLKKLFIPKQVLQLQMNDYKYHYLFTTFVSVFTSNFASIYEFILKHSLNFFFYFFVC